MLPVFPVAALLSDVKIASRQTVASALFIFFPGVCFDFDSMTSFLGTEDDKPTWASRVAAMDSKMELVPNMHTARMVSMDSFA